MPPALPALLELLPDLSVVHGGAEAVHCGDGRDREHGRVAGGELPRELAVPRHRPRHPLYRVVRRLPDVPVVGHQPLVCDEPSAEDGASGHGVLTLASG